MRGQNDVSTRSQPGIPPQVLGKAGRDAGGVGRAIRIADLHQFRDPVRICRCFLTMQRIVGAIACLGFTVLMISGPATRASIAKRVSGNLVYWDQTRGFDVIAANADVFSEISPFWYRVETDGRIVPYTNASGASYENPTILSFLRTHGILVIPTVANIVDGVWDGALVSRIIADPQLSAANIDNLVALAVAGGYDGIDLDYENLRASERTAFTTFVQQLAAALHARGKLLTVDVYAKTEEPGTWDGPKAQDWWAIGQAADQVRIMTYEYSWATSSPGPIAPLNWVADVMAFARSMIPADKIMQGVPLYGYEWVGQRGTPLVWREAVALANQNATPINWDSTSASPWFEYVSAATNNTVWFENAATVNAKLAVATAYDVGGVTLWRLGGEDPENWSALRTRFGGTPPTLVTITSSADRASLDVRVEADPEETRPRAAPESRAESTSTVD